VNRPPTHWKMARSRVGFYEPAKRFANQGNRGFPKFQSLNSRAKGKEKATEEPNQQLFWPYLSHAKSGQANTICKSWVVCFQCGTKGHVKRHCSAQWKSTNRKKAWAGSRSKDSGELSSKSPSMQMKDPPNLT
jgi:hypothetical protein